MEEWFFTTWAELGRITLKGLLTYVTLIGLLRFFGKRSLAKMNAFDFIVTVALGSIVASTLLSQDIPLTQGLVGLVVLLGAQFGITWLMARSEPFHSIITGNPALLFYQGRFLEDALRRERITKEEVRAAIREQGLTGLEEIGAVVLETNGNLSVMHRSDASGTALTAVRDYPPPGGSTDSSSFL